MDRRQGRHNTVEAPAGTDGVRRMRPAEFDRMFAIEDSYWWFVGKRRVLRSLIGRAIGRRRDLRILDAGCGTGATLVELARFGTAFGIDYEEVPLRYCLERGVRRAAAADVCRLPFRDGEFNLVIATDLLEHLADDAPAVREMARVLRPGGWMVVSAPASKHLWSGHDVALGHYRRYSRGQLAEALREVGLAVEWSTYAVSALYPVKLLVKVLGPFIFRGRHASHTFLTIPRWLNRILTMLMGLEARMIGRVGLLFGTSVFCVARKGEVAQRKGSAVTYETD
jgi:SAM-dependent methyltransferase